MRPFVTAIIALLVILFGAASYAMFHMHQFLNSPVAVGEDGVDFEIAPGSSFRRVSKNLAERELISEPRLLRIYARWTGAASEVQAGEYRILPGVTPKQLLDQFTSGDVMLYSFTIIEGWNRWDLLGP